jgi:hypothetical protein
MMRRSVVATLTAQLTDLRRRHREETARLRRELEAAHGENLLLRRRLAAGTIPDHGKHRDGSPPALTRSAPSRCSMSRSR